MLVQGVFTNVSSRYDLMNDVMSFGIHRLWKDALVDWLAPKGRQNILDLAGGTGDIAYRIKRRSPSTAVTVIDLTEDMIAQGQKKYSRNQIMQSVSWIVGDGMSMPFPNGKFDGCTIGFGIRNFRNIPEALTELYRILDVGGRLVILEFSLVRNEEIRRLYDRYSQTIIPQLGRLIVRDRESYQYLVESIRRFPGQYEFSQLMYKAGYENVKYRNLSMGIATLYSGWKL